MLWNIPKAVGSRHDFIKPSILEGNTHHLQHNSRHSVALRTPWHCMLRGTVCSVTLHAPWHCASCILQMLLCFISFSPHSESESWYPLASVPQKGLGHTSRLKLVMVRRAVYLTCQTPELFFQPCDRLGCFCGNKIM